ncbi:Bcr/CflA family drug resistance efflux transporter [Corallincola holothuriorum]|uniref:Bcr/CflA family efflux transporter n=1 Tax=Corallincola holothuriorum TaxID=2282215 RepID=A0A368NS33_9GAMM|nr:Bcr/CflA family multidrug efflux MFS transporter [Corallincola holothuriorum]RCU52753.1 Bcr/CflA family drug resistance efflux transporter [Corallincola holothuriorum]
MWRSVLLLASIVALTPLAIDMYLPAMPSMARDFSTPLSTIQGSMSTFLIGFAIGQLIHGPLTDALGRRPIALLGLTIFSLSSFYLANVTTPNEFLWVRVLQALGGASGSVVINAIITDRYRGHEAIVVRSTIIMVMTLAPMLAPTLGGMLLHFFGWRSIFVFLGAWSLMVLLWSFFALKESNKHRHALNFGNIKNNYISVVKRPLLWPWLLGMALNSGAFFAFLTASPYVYIEVLKIDPQSFGFYFGANVVVMMLGAAFNSRLARLFGPRTVLRKAQHCQLAAISTLVICVSMDIVSLWLLVPLCAIFMGLNSFVFPNASSLLLERFSMNAGTTSALLGATQFAMGALFSIAVAQGHGDGAAPMVIAMFFGGLCAHILIGRGLKLLATGDVKQHA